MNRSEHLAAEARLSRKKVWFYRVAIACLALPPLIVAAGLFWHAYKLKTLRETLAFYSVRGTARSSGVINVFGQDFDQLPPVIPEPAREWLFKNVALLDHVSFTSEQDVPVDALEPIQHLRGLQTIWMSFPNLSDDHCRVLKSSEIYEFNLVSSLVTHEGIEALSNIRSLRRLQLESVTFDEAMGRSLKRFRELESLSLETLQISPEAFAAIPASLSLKSLALPPIGEESIPHLIEFSQLEQLTLVASPIEEDGFVTILENLPKLRTLSLHESTRLSKTFLYRIREDYGVAVFGNVREW